MSAAQVYDNRKENNKNIGTVIVFRDFTREAEVEKLKTIQLRGERKDNKPYFKVYLDLEKIIQDRTLWETVSVIEEKITVFEKLRKAMRIAPTSGRYGLNDEGQQGNIRTIEKRTVTDATTSTSDRICFTQC